MSALIPLSDAAFEKALALVDEQGPIEVDDVIARLSALGDDVDRDELIDALVDGAGVWWLADCLLRDEHILPGRCFTHRLSAEEIAEGFIETTPDHLLLTIDESPSFDTPLGMLTDEWRSPATVLAGPPGCLATVGAGDLIGIRWVSRGVLDIARLDVVGDGDGEVEALRDGFQRERKPNDTAMLLDVLVAACRARPDAFAGAPPLSELLEHAGLSRRGDEVAGADFDWAALAEARHQDDVADLAECYDLDLDAAEHLATLAAIMLSDDPSQESGKLVACIDALRDPSATAAFLDAKVGRDQETVRSLGALARAVIGAAGPSSPAGAHLALARVAEMQGDAIGHAREVDRALRLDSHFEPAFEERAWVRADRGDIRAAVADLELVVSDDDRRLLVLDRYSAPGPMSANRNERCPCGSGRKHKACCGRTNGYRLVDRAPLLFEKAIWYASRPAQHDDVLRMIDSAFENVDVDLSYVPDYVFLTDPLLLHLALCAAGLMSRFADERSAMLPDDERALVADWTGARPRFLRVQHVDRTDVSVVDLVSDEKLSLGHHGVDDSVAPGRVILAAPLMDGERNSLLGWIPIADESVDELIGAGGTSSIVRAVALARRDAVATLIVELQATRMERFEWLFPGTEGEQRDEWTVGELIGDEHPELVAALEAGREQVRIEDGHEINPALHLAIHEIVAEQVLGDEPPEMWTTAIRLANLGYERHEILHMLGSTVSNQVFGMLDESRHYDRDEQVAQLAALPGAWELVRHAHGAPRRRARRQSHHRRS